MLREHSPGIPHLRCPSYKQLFDTLSGSEHGLVVVSWGLYLNHLIFRLLEGYLGHSEPLVGLSVPLPECCPMQTSSQSPGEIAL